MSSPAYRRMDVDERRLQLLELGEELFTRHAYNELSMADIARTAGISKALLYHYFPSKRDFFVATLARAAAELRVRTEPDPALPPPEQLAASLDAFLGWIEEHSAAYGKLMQSAASVEEVRELIEIVREATAARILAGLTHGEQPSPRIRATVSAWLWFMDGACLDWIEHRDFSRPELRDLLLGTLVGALEAGGDRSLAGPLQPAGRLNAL